MRKFKLHDQVAYVGISGVSWSFKKKYLILKANETDFTVSSNIKDSVGFIKYEDKFSTYFKLCKKVIKQLPLP